MTRSDLTDQEWERLESKLPSSKGKRGGQYKEHRRILNGILWVLRTGAPWQDIPDRYPSPATCHRRFQEWLRSGVFVKILAALATDLRDRGKLDLTECFVDATFVGAKKGGFAWAPLSGERVQSSWQLSTAMVFLSPSTWPVLRQLKSDSSTPRSRPASSRSSPSGSSATRPTTATRSRGRADRAAPEEPHPQDPGWSAAASLPPTLEGRADFRVAAELSPAGESLGA